jgi:hypothetical protein
LGHPANSTLLRHLGLAKAKLEILAWAAELGCDVCKRCTAPAKPNNVSVQHATQFNERVSTDFFFVKNLEGGASRVLHFVDNLTGYTQACWASDEGAKTISQAFMDRWVSIFGPPTTLCTDS